MIYCFVDIASSMLKVKTNLKGFWKLANYNYTHKKFTNVYTIVITTADYIGHA